MEGKYDPFAAVGYATSGDPLEFENEIVRGLADKMYDAVERKREEVARSTFGSPQEEEPVEDLVDEPTEDPVDPVEEPKEEQTEEE